MLTVHQALSALYVLAHFILTGTYNIGAISLLTSQNGSRGTEPQRDLHRSHSWRVWSQGLDLGSLQRGSL